MRPTMNRILGTLAALVVSATLANAQAPDTNNMTTVTFSAPVSLPGVTLPAGSYLFKLADSQVNRNIVQVFAQDRSKILATILAIPAERNEPADETVITFAEAPANTAPAVRYWYYPGQKRGQEFAYPKKQAQEIANAAHTSVLSIDTDDTSAEAMTSGKTSRVEPSAEPTQSAAQSTQPAQSTPAAQSTAPAPAAAPPSTEPQSTPPQSTAAPAPQPRTTEQPSATAAPQPAPEASAPTPSASTPSASAPRSETAVGTSGSTSGRTSLPKTASTLPLVGFAGLLALVGAFGVRALRRAQA
jgi:hypothetical protein